MIQLPRVFPAGGTDFSFGLLYDDHCVFSDDGLKKKLLEVQTVWYLKMRVQTNICLYQDLTAALCVSQSLSESMNANFPLEHRNWFS